MKSARLLGLFLDEAREQLAKAYKDLECFESHPQQPHTLQALMRHCHSLKGMAATMGFEPFVEMAHRMENLLCQLERRPRMWSNELAPLFHEGLSQLHEWTEAIAGGRTPERARKSDALIDRFDAVVGERPSDDKVAADRKIEKEPARWAVRLSLQVSSASPTHRIISTLRRIRGLGRVLRVRPPQLPLEATPTAIELELELASDRTARILRRRLRQFALVSDVKLTAVPRWTHSRPEPDSPTVWTRVPADSLDWIADTLRELAVRYGIRSEGFSRRGDDHARYLIRRLYDRISEMRLVPAASLGHRLEPAVSDAARREDKRARFSLSGGEIGLERALLDRLVEPLRHLVRNAVAHGIETTEERARAGKPALGRIELAVSRCGDRLRLELSDDGRGVDTAAVRRAAVETGAIDAQAAAKMNERESLDLVFLPAVTTHSQVSRVAGRGAGLDVVAAEFAGLDAEIELTSSAGRGTRFLIELPLRRAVVQTLVFSRKGQMFGIPLAAVRRATSNATVPEDLKVVDLAEDPGPAPRDGFLLVLDDPAQQLALLADEIVGRRDLWLQPLARSFSAATYVNGAAILDHGALALILDPRRLAAEV